MHQAARGGAVATPAAAEAGTAHSTALPSITMNFYGQTEPTAVYDATYDALLDVARATGRD